MVEEKKITICEWETCTEKATTLEPCDGLLWELCNSHCKLLKKQKKADNKF